MSFLSSLHDKSLYARTVFLSRRSIRMRNESPIISFTFDDFPRTALYTGGEILRKNGAAGTYYAAFGLMNTDGPVGRIFSETDLPEVLRRGHELGCHTFDHLHALKTDPKAFEDSILRNRAALTQLLPGASFRTHAYPLSIPRPGTKRRMQQYFTGCRGCLQRVNSGTADLNFLKAFFLEQCGGDLSKVKYVIDRNRRLGGLLIFATHDVTERPGRFGCTPDFFEAVVRYAVESGAKILTVREAVEAISAPRVTSFS